MRLTGLLIVTALLMTGCGTQAGAPVPTRAAAQAQSVVAKAVKSQADGARWMMNDRPGSDLTANEKRVLDALPAALKPTPKGTPAFTNLVSNFSVRPISGNPRFWSFSGVRLVAVMAFVPTRPRTEWFFAGSFDSVTGEVRIDREVELPR